MLKLLSTQMWRRVIWLIVKKRFRGTLCRDIQHRTRWLFRILISWLAELLPACEEGLYSMELREVWFTGLVNVSHKPCPCLWGICKAALDWRRQRLLMLIYIFRTLRNVYLSAYNFCTMLIGGDSLMLTVVFYRHPARILTTLLLGLP
jgi:hypothetical protein